MTRPDVTEAHQQRAVDYEQDLIDAASAPAPPPEPQTAYPDAVDVSDWAGEERTVSHVDENGAGIPFESPEPTASPLEGAVG